MSSWECVQAKNKPRDAEVKVDVVAPDAGTVLECGFVRI